MRSGLYNYTNAPELSAIIDRDPTKVWTPAELLAIAFAHPPNFPPGTEYEYNNTNYALLGLIVEKVDGRPLARRCRTGCSGRWVCRTPCSPPAPRTPSPSPTRTATCTAAPPSRWYGTPPYSPEVQAAARAGTLLPNDYTGVNHSYRRGGRGRHLHRQRSRHLDPGTGCGPRAQRRLSAPLARQPEARGSEQARGPKVRVRHHPTALGTEHDLFSRRRDPRLQLENQLRL